MTTTEAMPFVTEEFISELSQLINKHSMENGTGVPDWILANFLGSQLSVAAALIRSRAHAHGKGIDQFGSDTELPIEEDAE